MKMFPNEDAVTAAGEGVTWRSGILSVFVKQRPVTSEINISLHNLALPR
jgi:hypothetical protein